jgi:hypothetical protein
MTIGYNPRPGARWAGSTWHQNNAQGGPCVDTLRPCVGHLPAVRAVVAQLGGAALAEGQRPKMPQRPQAQGATDRGFRGLT